MPFRFRRTIRIAPGIRLNFNKKSASVRFGGRGAGVTFSSSGKTTRTIGIPGTGASWSTTKSISGTGTRSNGSGAGCATLFLVAIAVIALLSIVAALVGCSGPASSDTNRPVAMTATPAAATAQERATQTLSGETWRVTAVVDGDTVDVMSRSGKTERIRVIGIDTPERGECGYADATAALARLVSGKDVQLVPGARDNRDRYGRLLRYLDVNGMDAGLEQIRSGFAIARYDSRDGYGRHTRESEYVAADAGSPNVCGRSSPAGASSGTNGSAPSTQTFRSCAELNAVYPGGIARTGTTGNLVSGSLRPFGVTPLFDDALYQANRSRDGDADGIACEK